jgi:hypothetical protein
MRRRASEEKHMDILIWKLEWNYWFGELETCRKNIKINILSIMVLCLGLENFKCIGLTSSGRLFLPPIKYGKFFDRLTTISSLRIIVNEVIWTRSCYAYPLKERKAYLGTWFCETFLIKTKPTLLTRNSYIRLSVIIFYRAIIRVSSEEVSGA